MSQLFAIIFILIGIPVTIMGLWNTLDVLHMKSWHSTEGLVTKSFITEVKSEATSTYIPEFHYEYHVNGVHYHSDRVYLGLAENLSYYRATQCVGTFPPGTRIRVHCKRNNPKRSVLTLPGIKPSMFKLWVGILPLTAGVLLAISAPLIFVFYFFLLWFLPVIWLGGNGLESPFDHIEAIKNHDGSTDAGKET